MSGGMSNFGAYWLGALVGLIFAVALGATLSVVSPMPGEKPMEIAAAPAQQPEPVEPAQTSQGAASENPAPEAPEVVEPEAEAEVAPAPSPTPAVEPATPEPSTPEPTEPIVTAEAEPETQPTPAPAPEGTPEPEPEPEVAEESAAPVPVPPGINALRDNSERYRGDESQPLLSIVLVGLGDPALNIDEIFLLPSPLTVVVDAKADNAEDLVADARDSGFEALFAINQAAVDNLDALLDDAGPIIGVAVLDGETVSADAISTLGDGLATRNMGLLDATVAGGGSVYRAAQSIDLASAPGGRRFDDSQNSEAVYQALERAAFDARRAGAFVVYARPDPAIMTGLRRWMSLKANRSVAVAPLSTVMRKIARN